MRQTTIKTVAKPKKRNVLRRGYRLARYVIYRETAPDFKDHFISFIGAFTGIALIGLFNSQYFVLNDSLFLIGSLGASAALVYGAVNSPLAQPRNLIGGHFVSALIGVTVYKLLGHQVWLAAALAVALSIVAMQITKTLHPPGSATALIATIGSEKIKALGYFYTLSPVLSGVLILLVVALITNNLSGKRRYPSKWRLFQIRRRRRF